ncbi:hypothetical protein D3C87_1792020 [compost metagenome]
MRGRGGGITPSAPAIAAPAFTSTIVSAGALPSGSGSFAAKPIVGTSFTLPGKN